MTAVQITIVTFQTFVDETSLNVFIFIISMDSSNSRTML